MDEYRFQKQLFMYWQIKNHMLLLLSGYEARIISEVEVWSQSLRTLNFGHFRFRLGNCWITAPELLLFGISNDSLLLKWSKQALGTF